MPIRRKHWLHSDQLQIPETYMALAADDDVIVDEYIQFVGGDYDALGHIDVGQ